MKEQSQQITTQHIKEVAILSKILKAYLYEQNKTCILTLHILHKQGRWKREFILNCC